MPYVYYVIIPSWNYTVLLTRTLKDVKLLAKNKLVVIAIQEFYAKRISTQLRVIFGDDASVRAMTIKELKADVIGDDEIVLLSGKLIEPLVKPFMPKGIKCLIVERSINFTKAKPLLSIPSGSKIFVVNDTKRNTDEVVEELRQSIGRHQYIPYYPDSNFKEKIDIVVTPGERAMIPEGIKKVIDVGYRIADISIVIKLYELLSIKLDYSIICKKYIKSLFVLSEEAQMGVESAKVYTSKKYVAKSFFEDIITYSSEMKKLVGVTKKFALSDEPIHIVGNVGTGKSMLAEAIHNYSSFKNGHYVSINCESRTPETMEKELFGYDDNGIYIKGLFEIAQNGTLCIEEVGELSLKVQAKLIQFLQEKRVYFAGNPVSIPINLRIITTSTVDIKKLVHKGVFKKELYYLLTKMSCEIPQLKDRKEDLEILTYKYLKYNLNRKDIKFTEDTMEILHQYTWDGNVKELFNVLTYIACSEKNTVTPEDLPFFTKAWNKEKKDNNIDIKYDIDINGIIEEIEKRGFLEESLEILRVFLKGKKKRSSYGRATLRQLLLQRGMALTDQQLRLRLEILNNLDLILVRPGRAGTTISRAGEKFLELYNSF